MSPGNLITYGCVHVHVYMSNAYIYSLFQLTEKAKYTKEKGVVLSSSMRGVIKTTLPYRQPKGL